MTNRQKKKKKRRRVIKVGVNAEHMSNVLFTIAADEYGQPQYAVDVGVCFWFVCEIAFWLCGG